MGGSAVSGAVPRELSLFHHRVKDLIKRPPVTCRAEASAVEIGRLLAREAVGSVVVVDGEGAPIGIATDRDLSRKVVAEGRDGAGTPARAIMSAPVISVRPEAFAFEAVLEMTRRQIRHVAVVEGRRLVGVLSSQDFLALQTTHPVTLAREISRAVSVSALAGLAGRVTALVRQLVEEGVAPYDVGQLVAELNDRMVVRALGLAAGTLEYAGEETPPIAFCWLSLGSEARREQTLRTDQDNGLVYADPPAHLHERAAEYYRRLAGETIQSLIAIGFPPCPGDAMASNPTWCQPLSVWQGYFHRWMGETAPEHVLAATIYFDLRPLAGALELGRGLRELIRAEAPRQGRFLRLLAHDVVSRRLPLTVFGQVAVERRGAHRGTVDVKGAGGLQLSGAARLHGLQLRLEETNTIDRIRAAATRGLYTEAECREITDAYQHLLRLRLVHQLEQLGRGEAADNHITPARLSRADAVLFRDAFRTVERVQAGIRERFMTDRVS